MQSHRFFQSKTQKSFDLSEYFYLVDCQKKCPDTQGARGKIGHNFNEIQNQYIRFKFHLNTKPSDFYELSKSQHTAYPKNHKLIRDYSPFHGGKDRPLHGDFLASVSCTTAVLSGVRRIQQAKAEYMHRFHEARIAPAYFVPTIRKHGATPMLTAIKGESRPKTVQQLRLPAFPVGHYPAIPSKYRKETLDSSGLMSQLLFNFPTIECFSMGGSIMCMKDSDLVAWIHQGYAGGRSSPKRCTFFDVAFPSLTNDHQNRTTGLMLDSASFETLADAVQFVESTFSGVEVAA